MSADNDPSQPTADDPLALVELFRGGGEPWLLRLKPVIERQPNAPTFIGPARDRQIVPVRELTFQALKPNPPERWKVVVFGQNPYPRVESATGIAMFDNTFGDWADSRFGRVTSIRCIVKAACIGKLGIDRKTPVAEIRRLLAEHDVVSPPGWFQAALAQGALLLNAALTASGDGSLPTETHTAFWRPVVEAIVAAILEAKQQSDDPAHRGVVFAWWGSHARQLRAVVERIAKSYPGVPVRHVDHCNPAAQGDAFCIGDPFGAINDAIRDLGMDPIDWLPSVGWDQHEGRDRDEAGRMGSFITETMELHKQYLERLQEVKDEAQRELPPIVGVLATPLMGFADALGPVLALMKGLRGAVEQSLAFGRAKPGDLPADEVAALHLYTSGSNFYRSLNAALRSPDRGRAAPFFAYLRLLFSAIAKLGAHRGALFRGVALDLRPQYPEGGTVTWWGVSSCSSKETVARGFLGSSGRRTLFEVVPTRAVGIKRYSAFSGEEEYILAPGTRLRVAGIKSERGGLCRITLEELPEDRLVS